MASCKMLTQLLRSDHIAYTIRPVLNFDEVIHNFHSFLTEDIKTIFMINCGAVSSVYACQIKHRVIPVYGVPLFGPVVQHTEDFRPRAGRGCSLLYS
jgi:hypothetical protein